MGFNAKFAICINHDGYGYQTSLEVRAGGGRARAAQRRSR
jgi:hypothetical protein